MLQKMTSSGKNESVWFTDSTGLEFELRITRYVYGIFVGGVYLELAEYLTRTRNTPVHINDFIIKPFGGNNPINHSDLRQALRHEIFLTFEENILGYSPIRTEEDIYFIDELDVNKDNVDEFIHNGYFNSTKTTEGVEYKVYFIVDEVYNEYTNIYIHLYDGNKRIKQGFTVMTETAKRLLKESLKGH